MGERTDYVDSIELRLHVQESLRSGAAVRSAAIRVLDPLPADPAQCELFMGADAAQLADVLWETLPGGTIDALLIELMQRRASVFRVGLLSAGELVGLERARQHEGGGCCGPPREATERTEGAGAGAGTLLGVEAVRWPEGRVDAPWVESRHDWGDSARCRFWQRGVRCRWELFHDVIEHPHAP